LQAPYDHLLFSFHGLPERHLRKSDPTGCHCLQSEDCCLQESPARATCYRAQCLRTVAAFVRKSGVTRYSVAFQSRLGRDPWLKPYTDFELERLAREGVRRLRVGSRARRFRVAGRRAARWASRSAGVTGIAPDRHDTSSPTAGTARSRPWRGIR
jgi:hypothetical protein